jgi:hypothetical protein
MGIIRGERREEKRTRAKAKVTRASNRKSLNLIIQAKLKRMEKTYGIYPR